MTSRASYLPEHVRYFVLLVTVVAVLGLVNREIIGKEHILHDGRIVLLRLAPRDPRSLLQGDYMALRYSMAGEVATAAKQHDVNDGRVIVALRENGEADFVAIYDGQQLTATQQLLRFRRRGESVRLASDAFFFEEGQFEQYSTARFGELRVAENGDAVLTGLRDGDGVRLGDQQE
jgi:uncharacterized membrane-anchored protein